MMPRLNRDSYPEALEEFACSAGLDFKDLPSFLVAGRLDSNSDEIADWWRMPPPNLNVLESADRLAHVAARVSNFLTPDFPFWDLQDESGRSVAHEAARCGTLPHGFGKWGIETNDGWTVAHTFIDERNESSVFDLPPWVLCMKDDRGISVAHVAAWSGKLIGPCHIYKEIWNEKTAHGVTVAQLAVEAGCVPQDFDLWNILWVDTRPDFDHQWDETEDIPEIVPGWTIAHEAAYLGLLDRLPKLPEWAENLKDDNGTTVASVRNKNWSIIDNIER